MKIVTGYTGTTHVTAADDRALHAGIFGTSKYVLDVNDKLAASMVSPTIVRVQSGDLVMSGVHARIEYGESEDLEIEEGTEGYKRRDRIVARYEKQGDVESVTLKVLTGTPAADTPTAPDYNRGSILHGDQILDFPLYVIYIDGLNVTSVEPKFTVANHLDAVYSMSEVDAMNGGIPGTEVRIGTYNGEPLYRYIFAPTEKQIAPGEAWQSSSGVTGVKRVVSASASCVALSEEIKSYIYGENVSVEGWVGELVSLPFLANSGRRIDFTLGAFDNDFTNSVILMPRINNRMSEPVNLSKIAITIEYTKEA